MTRWAHVQRGAPHSEGASHPFCGVFLEVSGAGAAGQRRTGAAAGPRPLDTGACHCPLVRTPGANAGTRPRRSMPPGLISPAGSAAQAARRRKPVLALGQAASTPPTSPAPSPPLRAARRVPGAAAQPRSVKGRGEPLSPCQLPRASAAPGPPPPPPPRPQAPPLSWRSRMRVSTPL